MPFKASKDEFARLVELALDELPEQFASLLDEITIEIVDHPTREQLERMKIGKQSLLLGLYQGRPRTRRSVEDSAFISDVIFIFQESIEAVSRDSASLIAQVRKTVLHEIGHHFGMSESDLEKLGYG